MSASVYRKLFLPVTVLVMAVAAYSQTQNLPKWEAGINGGIYMYQGDLTPERFGSTKTIKPGLGFFGTRILSNALSVTATFSFASLLGDESRYSNPAYRQQRNFKFSTPVKELSLKLNYMLLQSNYSSRKFEPYVFAGGGFAFVKINRDYSNVNTFVFGETSDLQAGLAEDIAHKLPRILPIVPVGIGLKYNISERIALNTETTYRLMYSDYLDGFSKAASPKYKDHYLSQTIGVIYKFGKKSSYYSNCPVLKY